MPSSTPGFHRAGGAGASDGRGGRKGAAARFIGVSWQCSGRPQTWITTGAPGRATRRASASASTMSSAKKKELNPATTSKLSSA